VFERNDAEGYRVHLCFGPNCTPRGSRELLPVLQDAIRRAGIADRVEVIATSCRNRCEFGPSVNVYPGPVFYAHVTPEAVEEIVREHLVGGRPVERWRFREQPIVLQRGGRRR
jgi:(2Fe-2S) ferredoxin